MRKFFVLALLFVVFVGLLFASTASAQSLTVEQLQQQIQQLLRQLAELQARQGGQNCFTFNRNLKLGDGGNNLTDNDVYWLQTLLEREGFGINDNEQKGGPTFGESTASAVVGFQEKYHNEILRPYELSHGTGYVGPSTRAKLNSLCVSILPQKTSISVTTPQGGERYDKGDTISITWKISNKNIGVKDIEFVCKKGCSEGLVIYSKKVLGYDPNYSGSFRYKIPDFAGPEGGNYQLKLTTEDGTTVFSNTFSIGVDFEDATPSITVLSPNGGESYRPGDKVRISFSTNMGDKETDGITLRLEGSAETGTLVDEWLGGSPYEWSISSDKWTGGNRYKITAYVVSKGGTWKEAITEDSSDSYFTITSGTTISCPSPYHVLTTDNRCVWSCGEGTTPAAANNTTAECVCKSGYSQTGTDSFGRRVCAVPTPPTTAGSGVLKLFANGVSRLTTAHPGAGKSIKLTWESSGIKTSPASPCTKSGNWSGNAPANSGLYGATDVYPPTTGATYTLSCPTTDGDTVANTIMVSPL